MKINFALSGFGFEIWRNAAKSEAGLFRGGGCCEITAGLGSWAEVGLLSDWRRVCAERKTRSCTSDDGSHDYGKRLTEERSGKDEDTNFIETVVDCSILVLWP